MATGSNGSAAAPEFKVIVRVFVYYAVLITVGWIAWRYLPRSQALATTSLDTLFGQGQEVVKGSGKNAVYEPVAQDTLAATVALAMLASALLALPIAWVYTLTRSRRGYQQSVVQLLIILPVAVTGIVALVKYSLPLAFALGGIASAVRFRNTLEDSKDAVYIFLMTGLGIACAVDLPVAAILSMLFNILILALWMSDFGRTPVALEGRVAERRLQRARELARTGTFVARIDDEVLQNMTAEQLEGLAQRAWRRARENDPEGDERNDKGESHIRIRIRNAILTRPVLEARLDDSAKKWRVEAESVSEDGTTLIDYVVTPKKKSGPNEVLSLLRAAGGSDVVDSELR
jgi:hypothetical protein